MSKNNWLPWQRYSKGKRILRHVEKTGYKSLHRMMDRLVDDFLDKLDTYIEGKGEEEELQLWPGDFPPVSVTEDDSHIRVIAELPGVEEKDVNITFADNTVTIEGEKKEEKYNQGDTWYVDECVYGAFERSVRLPGEVKADKVKTEYDNGVLTLTFPKSEKAKKNVHKISITNSRRK